jgi:hypothetical protein
MLDKLTVERNTFKLNIAIEDLCASIFFERLGITKIEKMPISCVYDYKAIIRDKAYLIECKTRNMKSNRYDTHMLELKKYKAMNQERVRLEIVHKKTIGMLYLNFFDDLTYVYNLDNIDLETADIELKEAQTNNYNPNRVLVDKETIMLPSSTGIKCAGVKTCKIFVDKAAELEKKYPLF